MDLHEIFLASEIAGKSNGNGESVDLSDYYTKSQTDGLLVNKIDKADGMGLSENSFTDAEKTKLSGLDNYDDTQIKAETAETTEQTALNRSTLGYQRKNLLKNTAVSKTINGITFTVDPDGSVAVNGTATVQTAFIIAELKWLVKNIPVGKYTLTGCPEGGSSTGYRMFAFKANKELSYTDTGHGFTGNFDYNSGQQSANIAIVIGAGVNVDNLIFRPMLRYAEVTDDTYAPYRPSVAEYIADIEARITALEESRT